VIPGEPLTFDGLLAGIWADVTGSRPQLRACAVPGPLDGDLWRYAQAFGALLGVRPTRVTAEDGIDALFSTNDLIILGGHCQALIRRALSRSSTEGERALGPAAPPVAVLAAQKPRWPLQRILLVLSGDAGDHAAVDWALRLARPAVADVTVLAVVPPVPGMYRGLSRMEQTLRSLLTTDTALGNQMRQAGARLVEAGVESTLRLRQGSPEHQVCREVAESAHDLIVMATNPCRWWLRRLKGDPVCWLLSRIDRPLLFVEPNN
jgi:nucleotide-binding universal stress UspA family protein